MLYLKGKTRSSERQQLKLTFVVVAVGFAVLGASRMWWAAPNAPMLTNLDMIDDIDALLRHQFTDVRWLILQRHHSLTGYTWYQYFSAVVLNLDVRWEFVAYFSLALTLTFAIWHRAIPRDLKWTRFANRLAVFALPLVLLNLAAAGSRGMELGTFWGVAISAMPLLFSPSVAATWRYRFTMTGLFLLCSQLLLGGYIFGWVAAIFLGCLVELNKLKSLSLLVRTRIFTLLIASTLSSMIFYLMYLKGPYRDISSGKEFSGVTGDFLFSIKYIWSSFGSALIPVTTLDRFPPQSHLWIIWLGSFTLGAALGLAAFITYRSRQSGLLVLICYNSCLAITLLPVRDGSAYQMLNPWYSFHGKLSLGVALAVLIGTVMGRQNFRRSACLLIIATSIIAAVSYQAQFQRGVDERAYFGDIAISSLSPQLLATDSSGQTQLRLGLAQSEAAIRTMRRLKLGVHANPLDVRHLMSQVKQGLWIGGNIFDDGWLGRSAAVIVDGEKCPVVRINASTNGLLASNFVNLTRYPNIPVQRFEVGIEPLELVLEKSTDWQIFFLIPETTVRPSEISESSDTRDLAAHLQFSCESFVSG